MEQFCFSYHSVRTKWKTLTLLESYSVLNTFCMNNVKPIKNKSKLGANLGFTVSEPTCTDLNYFSQTFLNILYFGKCILPKRSTAKYWWNLLELLVISTFTGRKPVVFIKAVLLIYVVNLLFQRWQNIFFSLMFFFSFSW